MSDVVDNKQQSRYEIAVDGQLSVADYNLREGKLFITHVETPAAQRGQGIAARLMAGVVDDARARNLEIVPICGYAASYLRRMGV